MGASLISAFALSTDGVITIPSGMPADSIVFEVKLSNDAYPVTYGYDRCRISGYCYTGLVNDEDH